jgi:hypothetical protein
MLLFEPILLAELYPYHCGEDQQVPPSLTQKQWWRSTGTPCYFKPILLAELQSHPRAIVKINRSPLVSPLSNGEDQQVPPVLLASLACKVQSSENDYRVPRFPANVRVVCCEVTVWNLCINKRKWGSHKSCSSHLIWSDSSLSGLPRSLSLWNAAQKS